MQYSNNRIMLLIIGKGNVPVATIEYKFHFFIAQNQITFLFSRKLTCKANEALKFTRNPQAIYEEPMKQRQQQLKKEKNLP